MDFLTISLAVTAADTFIIRDNCFDGWTRNINLFVSLNNPAIWKKNNPLLEKTLQFSVVMYGISILKVMVLSHRNHSKLLMDEN
ncbi:hypothetical protein [Enterobacter cloacae complex sp. 339J8]|uniref:hypothetical protein n=1 Tax=Enterobacter cloacae complex sp. 339J8 TaxID=3395869 RepID=UPI003CE84D96